MGTAAGVSGRWHLLPLAVWLGSLVVLGLAVALFGVSYLQTPVPIDPGDQVRISGSGLTLFADPGDRPSTTCSLVGSPGTVPVSSVSSSALLSSGEYDVVGHTPRGVAPGSYALVCTGTATGLYAGHRLAFAEAVMVLLASLLLFLLALAGTISVVLARRRSRRTARAGAPHAGDPHAGDPHAAGPHAGGPAAYQPQRP